MVNSDQASQALEQTNKRLTELGAVSAKVENQSKGLKNALNSQSKKTREAGDAAGRAATKTTMMSRAFSRLRSRMLMAAASLAIFVTATFGLGAAMRTAAEFEKTMSAVAAISGVAKLSNDFNNMEREARRLGATTTFSATQAAEGLQFLAMAGFDTKQSIAALEGTLRLAQAGALGLGRAADIATNVLAGFGLEAKEIARVGDVLAMAASSSNTNVEELGQAFKFVAPAAGALGVSIEETSAMLGALANRGLKAGIAGRNLQTSMVKLVAPTDQAKEALARLGLTMKDVDPTVVGIRESLGKLEDASVMDLSNLFGVENIKTMLTLIRSLNSDDGFDGLITKMEQAKGRAEEMSLTMTDNLAGALRIVKSAIEEAFITGVQDTGLLDMLKNASLGAAEFINALQESGKMLATFTMIGDMLNNVGSMIGVVTTGIGKITGGLMPMRSMLVTLIGLWIAKKIAATSAATAVFAGMTRATVAMKNFRVNAKTAAISVKLAFKSAAVSIATDMRAAFAMASAGAKGFSAKGKAAAKAVAAGFKASAMVAKAAMVAATVGIAIAVEVLLGKLAKAQSKLAASQAGLSNTFQFSADFDSVLEDIQGITDSKGVEAMTTRIKDMIKAEKQAVQMLQVSDLDEEDMAHQKNMHELQIGLLQGRLKMLDKNTAANIAAHAANQAALDKEKAKIEDQVQVEQERIKLLEDALKLTDDRFEKMKQSALDNIKDKPTQIKARLDFAGVGSIRDIMQEIQTIQASLKTADFKDNSVERLQLLFDTLEKIAGLRRSINDDEAKAAKTAADAQASAEDTIALLEAELSGEQRLIDIVKDRLRLEELISKFRGQGMDDAERTARKILGLEQQKRLKDRSKKVEKSDADPGGVVGDSLTAIGGGGGVFAFSGESGKRLVGDRVRNIDANLAKLLKEGFKIVDPMGREIKVKVR